MGDGTPAETRELSEDVYVDMDGAGHVVSITVEHPSRRSDLSEVSFKRIRKANEASTPAATRVGPQA